MIEKILKEINRLKNELDGYSASEALDYIEAYINTISREPVSEDLEIENYINRNFSEGCDGGMLSDSEPNLGGVTYCDLATLARHFAEWQKDKMKETLQTEYEKGRFDMKEEMMNDAVEGTVKYEIGSAEIPQCDRSYQVLSDPAPITNAKLGDKVKIIICKTEQQ